MKTFLSILFLFITFIGYSQDTTKVQISTEVDIVSQYVFRGIMSDNAPNIQPMFNLSYKRFDVGGSGSVGMLNNYYELDIYVKYKICDFLTIGIVDFYADGSTTNYFDYSKTSAYHNLSGDIILGDIDEYPILFTFSTLFYGGLDFIGDKQQYTSYVEGMYINDKFDLFVGIVTNQSKFYGDNNFGVCNLGGTLKTGFKKIPINISLVSNPTLRKVYLIGIIKL